MGAIKLQLTDLLVIDMRQQKYCELKNLLENKSVDNRPLLDHFNEAVARRSANLPEYLKQVALGCPQCCASENDVGNFITVDFNRKDVRERFNPTCNVKEDSYSTEVQMIQCETCYVSNERKKWYQETDTCPLPDCEWAITRTKGCAKMICRCGVKWCWFCKKINKVDNHWGVSGMSCECGH